mgnify:CR=1 FL=1
MKRRIILLAILIVPFITLSQNKSGDSQINWIPLEIAKKYAKKYDKNILIYFYKEKCEYCDKMKKETLSNINIINSINNNFLPVKIDSRTKDTIVYNNKNWTNQQPVEHGYTFRHDFYAEVASFTQNGKDVTTTPTIVIFDSKFRKKNVFPGIRSKERLLRDIKPFIK